jgi:carboxyl-terminal processing protease
MVVETRGRVDSQNQKITASNGDQYAGMPVALLVSERSASATEIVAGALQDHDRALLLGRTTFGKGSVQTVFPLSDQSFLKLTTARWYTPSGRSIQRPYGIDAPVEVPLLSEGDVIDEQDRPTYRTDGGRVVLGGGGIRPDLLVGPDTLTRDERPLANALDNSFEKYREALFAFGISYNKAHPELTPGFTVTPAMLDDFYRSLRTAGVDVDREAYDAARRWVSYQLGYEVTYSRWGVSEARKWQNTTDPQVQVAVDLLRRSPNPTALFAAADGYAATHPGASGVPGDGGH